MLRLLRTDFQNRDFQKLVSQLDSYLKITDGDEHGFYNQFNAIDKLESVIVAYSNNTAAGCGAFKKYDAKTVEIKRMFTMERFRRKGLAVKILNALESWAAELKYENIVLETGIRQIEAVNFYKKNDYEIIPNYGQYLGMENSLCFEKQL